MADPVPATASFVSAATHPHAFIKLQIKKEKQTPPPSPSPDDALEPKPPGKAPVPVTIKDEVDTVTPVKSSHQLLNELFQTLKAVLPVPETTVVAVADSSPGSTSKKKHKKEKKAKKSKHREKEGEVDGRPSKERRKKVKKEKKEKHDKGSRSSTEGEKRNKEPPVEVVKVKPDKRPIGYPGDEEDQRKKRIKRERSASRERTSRSKDSFGKVDRSEAISSSHDKTLDESRKTKKITIKSLKDSAVLKKAEVVSEKKSSNSHRHSQRRRSGSHASESSILSLSDEETYNQERERYFEHYRSDLPERRGDRRSGRDGNRSRERSRDRNRRTHREENRFYAGSDRFRDERRSSFDRDVIDKKRLLEIARKNAIRMLESGKLPGTQNITAKDKEKVLAKMRFGGKSVDELTEFCKKLAQDDGVGYVFSDGDSDADVDAEGNATAFNHPFVLKDKGPIVMNIRNSVPIPPKTSEQTKAILMQFPVSSGQHHRLNESEWVPVVKPKVQPAPTTADSHSAASSESFAKSLPAVAVAPQQPPAAQQPTLAQFQNPPETLSYYQQQHPVIHAPLQLAPAAVHPPEPDTSSNIFTTSNDAENLDVTSIISKRLNAMRKLQDNPHDTEALKLMYNSQKDMSSWANSKFVPGQFTGSTGANILSARELQSGFQAWAKKDQLMSTTPVSGGMGMHLLQKMGWRPGEGLGKEKNGSLQPLLLEVKLDKKGLLTQEENPNAIRKQQKKLVKQQHQQIVHQQLIAHQQQQLVQPQHHLHQQYQPPMIAQPVCLPTDKHPVSQLGELAAKEKWKQPVYISVEDSGPPHQKRFLFAVQINGVHYTPTQLSNTKKDAKMEAAKCALLQMGFGGSA